MKRINEYEKKRRHPLYQNLKFANKDLEGYKDNGNLQTSLDEVAKKNFIYALMSSNAYKDPYFFDLSKYGWNLPERYQEKNGFSADVYKNKEEKIIVIAFRGTEGLNWKDWIFGNLMKSQYKSAKKLLNKIKNKKINKEYKFISVGHSLGGGLALHTSISRRGIEAITFNTSPRVWKPEKHIKINQKIIITEKGEILKIIRGMFISLDNIGKVDYYEYDFLKGTAIKEHSMYLLARGLLKVAATSGNRDAIDIMECIFKHTKNL